jgi:hypothetical protein
MNNDVSLKEIVFCDLTISYKNKIYELKKLVYKNDGNMFYNKKVLSKLNISEPVDIVGINIISRLGFENQSKEFTEVKRNDEIRNNITGAYE